MSEVPVVEFSPALRPTEPDHIAVTPALPERTARYEIDQLACATAAEYTFAELRALDTVSPTA